MTKKMLYLLLMILAFSLPWSQLAAQDDTVQLRALPFEPLPVVTDGQPLAYGGFIHHELIAVREGDDKVIGQAWGDYDNDGWLDLYVTDSDGANQLLHNRQGQLVPSSLSDMTALADHVSSGAIFADYDNDGWADLYVLNWGEANTLFHNEAGEGFVEVTAMAGVGDTAHGRTAAWGDYDNDGWLDLYVTNWSCSPRCGYPNLGDKDRLYHNNGDGTFTDVTGLLTDKVFGAGFVASFVDYDNDGDADIYLVNDEFVNPVGNVLWRNDGAGCEGWCFMDVASDVGADTQVMGMGLFTGDYDNDGDHDLYFSNVGELTLLQNQGDGTFNDMTDAAGVGVGSAEISWGTILVDVDNDGWRDIFVAVTEAPPHFISQNPLMLNNGDGTFRPQSNEVDDAGHTLGVAYADYNRDGWVDWVIGDYDAGYSLYENAGVLGADNHRISVQLVGGGGVNHDAIGSRVYVTSADGMTQMQEVQSGASLGGGNALELYFGVGTAESIAQLEIIWVDGTRTSFSNLAVDMHYVISY